MCAYGISLEAKTDEIYSSDVTNGVEASCAFQGVSFSIWVRRWVLIYASGASTSPRGISSDPA